MSKQLLDTPAAHPFSLAALLDNAIANIRELAFSTAQSPILRLAEAAVVALMQKLSYGRLRILTFSRIYEFPAPSDSTPQPSDQPAAELRVVRDVFWLRLLAMGDLGFSEAYMFGDVECDDLVALFQIFLANRERLTNMNSTITPLFSLATRITSSRFVNSLTNSRSNISAHYDISNDMFQAFLSSDMTYSCAIFDDLDGDLKRGIRDQTGSEALARFGASSSNFPSLPSYSTVDPAGRDELHEAQLRKLRHIIHKADLRPGHRLLEIGSGWGSLAILAVQLTGCEVDTLTLSVHQKALAEQRIAKAGLEDKIRVHLMDYRAMPKEWEGRFHRVISIEMIEAVGREFLSQYFSVIDWALVPKGGVGVIQAITIPEARFEKYIREIDFIQKWPVSQNDPNIVFPGGFLPTVTLLLTSMETGSKGRLICDSITNIGPHYARTLREWRRRFRATFDSHIAPALHREYPETMGGPRGEAELQVFKRKWLYYFCYCEIGFTDRVLGDHILTFAREGASDYAVVPFE